MMTLVRTAEGAQGSEAEVATALDELAREGARRMILAALEVEVEEYRQQHRDARDSRGHALVVRNGPARPRRLTVGSGTVTIRAPPRRRGSTKKGVTTKKGVRSCNPTFRGCGGELVHLVSLVYLVCVVRRTSETRQTRAPDRLPLNRPPLAPRTYISYRVMDTPLTLQ